MHGNVSTNGVSYPQHQGGLVVRTGLRGGACVELGDEIKTALQTLTAALGTPPLVATAPAVTTSSAPLISS